MVYANTSSSSLKFEYPKNNQVAIASEACYYIVIEQAAMEPDSLAEGPPADKRKKPFSQLTPAQQKHKQRMSTDSEYAKHYLARKARNAKSHRCKVLGRPTTATPAEGLTHMSTAYDGTMVILSNVDIPSHILKLQDFRNMWFNLHPNHPHKLTGLNVIDHILSNPDLLQRYSEPYKLAFREIPTFADITLDLQPHTRFLNCITGESSDTDFLTFLLGWESMRDNADPNKYTPYAATDVVSQPGRGLHLCFQEPPEQLHRDDVVIREDGGHERLVSSVTPAGSITPPRIDGHGSGQVFCMTYGIKLVLFWDWSEEIAEYFDSHGREIEVAVKNLNNVNWSILTPGDYLIFSPGQIYAGMSPINSIITGWTFVQPHWLMEGTLEKLLTWELNDLEKRSSVTSLPLLERTKQIEVETRMWNSWRNKRGLSQEMKNELQRLKKTVESRLSKIKKAMSRV